MKGRIKNKTKNIIVLVVATTFLGMSFPVSSSTINTLEENEFEVCILRPSSNILIEWNPGTGTGYTEVDDETPDETTTYIGTSNNGDKDVYGINPSNLGEIKKIIILGRFITDFSDSRFQLLLYNKNTQEYELSEPMFLRARGGWETISCVWDKNPFTDSKWENEDLYNIGIGIRADYCEYGAAVFCTQVYAVVLYTPVKTIEDIVDLVSDMDLPRGIHRSITTRLDRTLFLLEKNKFKPVLNMLKSIIHQTEALSGKKLTTEQANEIIYNLEQILKNI